MAPLFRAPAQTPLGNRITAYHRYVERVQLDPSTGGIIDEYIFCANGLYDPNVTGTGHQPMGFDQMYALYSHYTVTHATITVTFVNGTDTSNPQAVAIRVANGTTATNSIDDFLEQRSCPYSVLGVDGSGAEIRKLKQTVDIARFLGRPNLLNEDDCRGSSTANPVEKVMFILGAEPFGSVDGGRIDCLVEMEFKTVWTEPEILAQS